MFNSRGVLGPDACMARTTSLVMIVCGLASQFVVAEDQIPVANAILKTIEATTLAAQVTGKVEELNVREGDLVQKGQALGKIQDASVQLHVERARVALSIAQSKSSSDIDLQLAQRKSEVAANELERAEAANERIKNTYPPKEIDRLRLVSIGANLEVDRAIHQQELAKLEVQMAENDYQQAAQLLSQHQIIATADGVVVSVEHRPGEWVEPGVALLQIVKVDRLRIEGFIQVTDVSDALMHREAQVVVLRGNTEHTISGRVVFVHPDTNPVNGQVRIYLEIDNSAGKYRPGMRVRATIGTDAPASAGGPDA